MWRIRTKERWALPSTKQPLGVGAERQWLPKKRGFQLRLRPSAALSDLAPRVLGRLTVTETAEKRAGMATGPYSEQTQIPVRLRAGRTASCYASQGFRSQGT
jgi:hypothetical protein